MSLKIRQAQKAFEECKGLVVFKERMANSIPKAEIVIDIDSIKALQGTAKWRQVEEPVVWCVFSLLTDSTIPILLNTISSGFNNALSDAMSKEVAAEEMHKIVITLAQDQETIYAESKVALSKNDKTWTVTVTRNWNSVTDIGYGVDPDKLKAQIVNSL